MKDELHDILAAAGDVTVVAPGSGRDGFLAAAAGADGIVLSPMIRVDEEVLAVAPDLKVVATSSVGYDAFDVPFLTEHGVALCNTPGVLNAAVADLTVAMLLMLLAAADGVRALLGAAARGDGANRCPRWPTTRPDTRSA